MHLVVVVVVAKLLIVVFGEVQRDVVKAADQWVVRSGTALLPANAIVPCRTLLFAQ